jgi:transcriptional regulator with XRE-family HTH domain
MRRRFDTSGRAFAEARREAKLTQDELVGRSGVDTGHIARVETGRIDPGFEVMQKMAAGIGVPLEPILDRAWELAEKQSR